MWYVGGVIRRGDLTGYTRATLYRPDPGNSRVRVASIQVAPGEYRIGDTLPLEAVRAPREQPSLPLSRWDSLHDLILSLKGFDPCS
jgi:hypothetical protein